MQVQRTDLSEYLEPTERKELTQNKYTHKILIIITVMAVAVRLMTMADLYFGSPLCPGLGQIVCMNCLHYSSRQVCKVGMRLLHMVQRRELTLRRLVKLLKLHS